MSEFMRLLAALNPKDAADRKENSLYLRTSFIAGYEAACKDLLDEWREGEAAREAQWLGREMSKLPPE